MPFPHAQSELVAQDLTKACLTNSSQFEKNIEKNIYILTQQLKMKTFREVISIQNAILQAIPGPEYFTNPLLSHNGSMSFP